MTSDDGFGFLGVVGIAVFGVAGAAIGAAVGVAAASTAVGTAVGAAVGASAVGTAVAGAAIGAAGGAAIGSTVGVAAVTAMDRIATIWINKYRKKTREWIENHPRKGSLIYEVLLKAHEWVDDRMAFLKANLIVRTKEGKEIIISEEEIPPYRAEALGLTTKNVNPSKRARKVATAEEILKMKVC